MDSRKKLHFFLTDDEQKIGILQFRPPGKLSEYPLPLILIHGFGQNHLTWTDDRRNGLADALAEDGFEVFTVDMRGSGYSKPSKYNFTVDDLVEDLAKSVDYISKITSKEKFVLAGHSLGGTIAVRYTAGANTSNVHALILFGTPAIYGKGEPAMKIPGQFVRALSYFFGATGIGGIVPLFWRRAYFLKILGVFGIFGYPFMLSKNLLRFFPLYPAYPKNIGLGEFCEKVTKGFEVASPKVLIQVLRWAGEEKITSYDGKENWTDMTRNIKCPTLIIAGRYDRLAPPYSIKPYLRLLSGEKKYVEFEAGHLDLVEGEFAKTKIKETVENFLLNL